MVNNYLPLIEENKVNDLSFLVFNQKLTPTSTETYTDTLSEEEENAVIQKMLDNHPTGAWRDFVAEYFKHYPPCNSSVDLLLSNLNLVVARDLLKQIIKSYSIMEDQAQTLCQAVLKDKVDYGFHLVQDYCNNPRRMNINHTLLLSLQNIDDKYADHGDIHVKLVNVYQTAVQQNGKLWVPKSPYDKD